MPLPNILPHQRFAALPRNILFWLAVQIPVIIALNFLYYHRPVADPTAINYDVRIYYDVATALLNGQLPYRGFFFQYPPLALFFFILPRLFAPDLANYFFWFNVELLGLAWLGVIATAIIARRIGQSLNSTLLTFSVGLLALGSIVPQRYDIAPTILVVLALAAWLKAKHDTAWALLAIGTLTKIYPALLFPLFTLAAWRENDKRAVARGWIIFSVTIFVFMLPFLLSAPEETLRALSGQAGRGLQIESTFAALLLVGRYVGLPAEIVYQPQLNSWDVTAPFATQLGFIALGLQIALLGFVYARFFRKRNESPAMLVRYAAATIALALLTSKVFSPQFMLWLFPIAFLSGTQKFRWTAILFLLAALLTQLVFPFLWGALKQGAMLPLLLTLTRDVCLATLGVILLRASGKNHVTS